MKTLRDYLLVTLLMLLCGAFEAPSDVNAQQIDLSVSPPISELLIKPGAEALIPYTITNREDSMRLKLLVKTFTIKKEGESVDYGSVEKAPLNMSFVDESSDIVNSIVVDKTSTKKIFLKLSVPTTTKEGDYYLAVILETQPEFLDKQYSARIKSQIASPLLVMVTKTGRMQALGAISIFKIGGEIFDSFDSIPVTLRIKNQGTNAVNAKGSIAVRGSFGESAIYQVQSRNIRAKSEVLMTSKSARGDTSLILKGFFIGRYGVSASVMMADGTVQLNKSSSFFAFPFKLISFLVLGSFIGIIMLRKRR